MKQAVLRAQSFETLLATLKGLGFEIRKVADQVELTVGACCTPPMQTTTGLVVRIMMTDEQAALLPAYIDPPEMLCDWHSDDVEQVQITVVAEGVETTEMVERPLANPSYTVTDGVETWTQEAGIFQ